MTKRNILIGVALIAAIVSWRSSSVSETKPQPFIVEAIMKINARCPKCGKTLEKHEENDLWLHVKCPKCGLIQDYKK